MLICIQKSIEFYLTQYEFPQLSSHQNAAQFDTQNHVWKSSRLAIITSFLEQRIPKIFSYQKVPITEVLLRYFNEHDCLTTQYWKTLFCCTECHLQTVLAIDSTNNEAVYASISIIMFPHEYLKLFPLFCVRVCVYCVLPCNVISR